MQISSEVSTVLKGLSFKPTGVEIVQKLDRDLYVKVNKILEALGGKWNKKAKLHLFDGDPEELVTQAVMAGSVVVPKDDFDFFPTPPDLAEEVVFQARIQDGMSVLEPSAGDGAILDWILRKASDVTAVETQEFLLKKLLAKYQNINIMWSNFLTLSPVGFRQFDRIVMNPPFSKLADVKHVNHALRFLNPGGRLVSIMSPGWTFRSDKLSTSFREMVEKKLANGEAEWHNLESGAFKSSGTMVNTVLLTLTA